MKQLVPLCQQLVKLLFRMGNGGLMGRKGLVVAGILLPELFRHRIDNLPAEILQVAFGTIQLQKGGKPFGFQILQAALKHALQGAVPGGGSQLRLDLRPHAVQGKQEIYQLIAGLGHLPGGSHGGAGVFHRVFHLTQPCAGRKRLRRGLVPGHAPLGGHHLLEPVLGRRYGGAHLGTDQRRAGQGLSRIVPHCLGRGSGPGLRLTQQIGTAGQGLIQSLQGFLEVFVLVKDIQRPADGQGHILRRRGLWIGHGTLLLHAQEHPLGLVGAGQRIQHTLCCGGGFGLFRLRLAHGAKKGVLLTDIKQRGDGLPGQGRIILRRTLQHFKEGMLGQGTHGIGIKDILIDFTALGTIVLVCPDFVGIGGDAHQIHHAPAAQGTHAFLEGMLLVAIRHHPQAAAIGPKAGGFFLHIAMQGQ